MIQISPAQGPLEAVISVPGSKSYTNRALAVAALAEGRSRLQGTLLADDTQAMVRCLRALGIDIVGSAHGEELLVEGAGGPPAVSFAQLEAGGAGTAARFLTAICATGQGQFVVDGDERMRQRPIGPLLESLRALGGDVVSQFGNDCPPVTINANGLAGGRVTMDGSVSSQYFTALCQVGPLMANGLDLVVDGDLVSKPYLDLTQRVMAAFGVDLINESYGRFLVAPDQAYQAAEYQIEPDASSASYFFAAAALCGGSVTVAGLHRDSLQGDVAFVDVLAQMGCLVEDRPAGLTVTGPDELQGVNVDMNAISDVALTLAAIAPFAVTPTEIRGIEHARAQESDRVAAMATELARLGVRLEERPDGWRIEPSRPRGTIVSTYRDHRLAMSLALIGLRVPGLRVSDSGCVAKTFPAFWQRLDQLLESQV